MQKNLVLIIGISFILGGMVGYLVGGSQNHPNLQSETPPSFTTKSSMHGTTSDAMVEELKTRHGSDRDEAFIENMILHHQSAIDMSEILLESTMRPELKQLAHDIISAQTRETEMMRRWLKEWYGR